MVSAKVDSLRNRPVIEAVNLDEVGRGVSSPNDQHLTDGHTFHPI